MLRQHARKIFDAGVDSVKPDEAVRAHLDLDREVLFAGSHRVPLHPTGSVLVVGGGKAGAPMAAAVEDVLGGRVNGGLVCVKYGHLAPTEVVRVVEAAHPVPDRAGLAAASEIAQLLKQAGGDDLVLCLLSGGGSALLPLPAPPVTLTDKQEVTDLLLRSGADIAELNCVRKHLSLLKGGGLARLAYPAWVVTLILSDVVGDPLDVIASGPTVPDPTTFSDALAVLEKYGLTRPAPATVLERLKAGAAGDLPETPKPGDPELAGSLQVLVGTNDTALDAAAVMAQSLGYETIITSSAVTGDTRQAAEEHARRMVEATASRKKGDWPMCFLSGGETTVHVTGSGKGGRNQEFALAAAMVIRGVDGVVILSGGTDGTDGPTDAAGAVVDGTTCHRAKEAGLDPRQHLENNDSYPFFQALGDLLVTGPTLTNVMDLRVALLA